MSLLLPFVVVAALALLVTLSWPEFWTPRGELAYDENDATRGDWKVVPHQGHSPDTG